MAARAGRQAYRKFIERQMKEAQESKDKSRSFTPTAGWCLRSTAVPLDAGRRARPVFLNMCSHVVVRAGFCGKPIAFRLMPLPSPSRMLRAQIQPPLADDGTPVVDKAGKVNAKLAMTLSELQIPLTVGPARMITVRGGCGVRGAPGACNPAAVDAHVPPVLALQGWARNPRQRCNVTSWTWCFTRGHWSGLTPTPSSSAVSPIWQCTGRGRKTEW